MAHINKGGIKRDDIVLVACVLLLVVAGFILFTSRDPVPGLTQRIQKLEEWRACQDVAHHAARDRRSFPDTSGCEIIGRGVDDTAE